MAEPGGTRQRLAAVLAADAAGYTRLMQGDPAATLAALDDARAVFRDAVAREAGQVVDTAGDSVLAVFGTATGAVRAALAAQEILNVEPAGTRRMRFRIGVHLGELLEKSDGTVYGDGVNIAARLQGLAAPGGLCISAAVLEQVGARVDARFDDLGLQSVKNVARPLHVYAWGGGAAAAPEPPVLPSKPVVALGSFEASGGAARELARAVRDGIATALANQTGIVLVAEPDAAQFVVNASFQAAATRYRANLHLLERASGRHFGADRFEGTLDDPFAAQDDLAYRAYNAVRFALHAREMEPASRTDIAPDADTATLLLRAGSLMFRSERARYAEARALLEIAVAREPDAFMALTMLAHAHLAEFVCGYRAVARADADAARALAARAVRLENDSDYVHFVLSEIALVLDRDADAAVVAAERSLELNPYYAFATTMLGAAAMAAGDPATGVKLCEKVVASEPRLQFAGWVMQFAAVGCWLDEAYPRAVEWARRAERRSPDQLRSLIVLTAALAETGDATAARTCASRVLAVEPGFRIDALDSPLLDDASAARLGAALRAAGLA